MKTINQLVLDPKIFNAIESLDKVIQLEQEKLDLYLELKIALVLKDRPDLTCIVFTDKTFLFFENLSKQYGLDQIECLTKKTILKTYKGG